MIRATRPSLSVVLFVALVVTLGACVSGKSLADRHSMSRLWTAPDSDEIFFEASAGADYPIDSAAAEEERERWIAQWLERKRLCSDGFEVVDRVRIGSAADNPYRHDLRYTLRCASAP